MRRRVTRWLDENIEMSLLQHKVSKRVEKELHQTKVVIRHLPPDFTEEKVKEVLAPLPSHNYFYFAPGDPTLGPSGYSRAYINLTDENELVAFRDRFDGLVLETEKGTKCRAVVEFAPFQNVPKKGKHKVDPRSGTIEQDPEYMEFVKALTEKQQGQRPSVDLSTLLLEQMEAQKIPSVQKTPLIEFLKEKKAKGNKSKHRVVVVGKRSKDEAGKSRPRTGDEKASRRSRRPEGRGRRDDRPHKDKEPSSARSETRLKVKGQEEWAGRGGETTQRPASSAPSSVTVNATAKDDKGSSGPVPKDERSTVASREHKERGTSGAKDMERAKRQSEVSSEGREGGRGDGRHKDRPDRAIYTPRSRVVDVGGGGRGEGVKKEEGAGNQRDQESSGRHTDGSYAQQRGGYPSSRGRRGGGGAPRGGGGNYNADGERSASKRYGEHSRT